MSKYQCIVFDFDGVIVESNHIKMEGYFHVCGGPAIEEKQTKSIKDHVQGLRGKDRFAILDSLKRAGIAPSLPLEILAEKYNEYCEEKTIVSNETNGATAALSELKASGYKLAVNSATPDDVLIRVIEARKLSHFFDFIYGSGDSKVKNMDKIARAMNLDKEDLLFVGDAPADFKAAEEYGCDFVGMINDSNNFVDSNSVNAIRSLIELPGLIQNA